VQGEPSLFIPTISGGFAQPIITNDCTSMQAGFLNKQTKTCSTVIFNGAITSRGATYCFPGPYNNRQPIIKCDLDPIDRNTQLPAVCPTIGDSYQPVTGSSGTPLCCGVAGPLGQGAEDNNTYNCVYGLTGFSTFASGPTVDTDQDGQPDLIDNCPNASKFFQEDQDHDARGDVCDNCPAVANQNQKNTTGASVGDACNCALPGVKLGPTGAACPSVSAPATPAPATPGGMGALLGLGFMALGIRVVAKNGRRRLNCGL